MALNKGWDQKAMLISLSLMSYMFCLLAVVKAVQANSDWWESPTLLVVGIAVGVIKDWRAFVLHSRRVPVLLRARLVEDMQFIGRFDVFDWYSPVRQYMYGREPVTDKQKSELDYVRRLVESEQFRPNWNHAIEDSNEAMWNAYKSGKFHKALGFATQGWLEVILLVSRSRLDSKAAKILDNYERYWA